MQSFMCMQHGLKLQALIWHLFNSLKVTDLLLKSD